MPPPVGNPECGNTAEDWEIFEILCGNTAKKFPPTLETIDGCTDSLAISTEHHHNSSIDVVATLRSEIAALTYKRERLSTELSDVKSSLCSRESECESLRAQTARQSALIGSLHARLQAVENREQSVQSRCESTIQAMQRERRAADGRCKDLQSKMQLLETHLASEESQREQLKLQLHELLRRLGACLDMDVCESTHLTIEGVVSRAEELMTELQRNKAKVSATCDTLSSCENELLNVKSLANIEKQRLSSQLESSTNHTHELESRCRQYERDLQLLRDRLTESEINAEKLKDELRGFESRCHRLQSHVDRTQGDRLQFLRSLATQLDVRDPCETLIKDKIREFLSEKQTMHSKLHSLQDQLSLQQQQLKETQDSTECRLRAEVEQRADLEDRLEKCHAEIDTLRKDHLGLSEYLQRLSHALNWSECATPPQLGNDTNVVAESLLQRAERMARDHHRCEIGTHKHLQECKADRCGRHPQHHQHHQHHHPQHHHPHHDVHAHSSLRRERSCHDIPLKESSGVYTLQRRVRNLREQVQRRDMHVELLRRKLAIIEDGARGKCALKGDLDDTAGRLRKANKHIDKLTSQLDEARAQVAEVKVQLAQSADYKITSLERARKIDELNAHICELDEERTRLLAQLSASKERLKLLTDSAESRRCRDEVLINSLRQDVARLQTQLSDSNHRLSQLQAFRTSVARTLHLRDLPETDLLQRLQALCSAHQEFSLLSRRYESASPVGDHPCTRYDDSAPPSTHCHRPSCEKSPLERGYDQFDENHCQHHHHHHHQHAATSKSNHRQRSKSRPRENRLHDDCFDSAVHRQHFESETMLNGGGCRDDEFDSKNKFS